MIKFEDLSEDAREFVSLIQSEGYRVYMRKPKDTYCHYTDGERVAYAQWSKLVDGGVKLVSVHKPSKDNGTGFQWAEVINAETLRGALYMIQPSWGRGEVKKYKNWDDFHNASKWNRGYKLVSPSGKEATS